MSFRANFDGSYADYRVNDRWLAWKAALATATPSERFALVPVEPTEAMIEAFNRKDSLPYPEPNRVAYKAKHCYSAMLSARPEVK